MWCTDTGWERVREHARSLPKRGGRGAGGQVADAVANWLRSYRDHVAALGPNERPCFVGTLIGYPGAEYSGKREVDPGKPGKNKIRRRHETRQEGSRRVYIGPSVRDLLSELVRYGLVLPDQRVQTRPAGTAAHPYDDGEEERVVRTARPLSDVLLTAIVLETGPLPDGPLHPIERQLLRRDTAWWLWAVALRQAQDRKTAQAALRAALPSLLVNDERRITALRGLLPSWSRTLEELVETVDEEARSKGGQIALPSAGVPV